jgi:decaprenylphospho-beta-D-erythro-pentofuranosid-2-ulose 2-reductase
MENAFGQPQNVVVFGGSSDIARAITRKLCAARTSNVVLAGRNQKALNAAADEAKDYGATQVSTVIFDAEEPENAAKTVDAAFAAAGEPVDLVIIAVGLLGKQTEDEDDPEATLRMASVNYTWPVTALAQLRKLMVAQGHGRILLISSVAAIRVRRTMYNYGAAKAGLDRFAFGYSQGLEGTGVKIQILRPGYVRTKMIAGLKEAPFTTGPNEVADYVMRGIANDSTIIWSPPILRYVFFMLRHLPNSLWRAVMDRQ